MRKLGTVVVTIVSAALVMLGVVRAQQGRAPAAPGAAITLTPMDYIEIQQLVIRYAKALDGCTNNGYDYADLYAPDGWFAGSTDGVMETPFKGRERLAEAAGGGSLKCAKLKRRGGLWIHVMANHLITPSAGGATGHVDLVYPLEHGAGFDIDHMGHVGHYEDVYVKTDKGWRFKSRVHVQPPTRQAG